MPRRIPFPAPRVLLALMLSAVGAQAAYDAPNFDRRPVDPDALSLGARERGELATLLATVAANFRADAGMDDDLREKALGVALTLAPLHPGARATHASLLSGKTPAPLPGDLRPAQLSAQLWRLAEKLAARDAEPADRRLAPMLMEIALLIQPGTASDDRRLAYQQASEAAPVNWNRFLTLQPKEHPSNARAIALFRPVSPTPEPAEAPTPTAPADPTPSMAKIDETPSPALPPTPQAPPVSEIKVASSAIAYLALDREKKSALSGSATFKVRDPTEDEAGLFGLLLEAGSGQGFEMRLTYDRDGPVISNTDHAERLIRRVFRRWPDRRLGEFTFLGPATQTPPGTVDLSLPALFMLSSTFSGETINEAFAPAREFLLAGELGRRGEIELPAAFAYPELARAAAAAPLPPRALFLPDPEARAERELLDAAIAGEAGLLLTTQLIVYESVETLQPLLFGDTPENLLAAMEEFSAVQSLRETMDVGVIARNEFVQQRLRALLEKWPGHLSARLLLAYGARPADMTLTIAASLNAITQAVEPVAAEYTAHIEGTGGNLLSDVEPLLETATQTLTGLRLKVDPRARDCLTAAERTLEAYQAYLSLNNRDSSLGQQRLRELQEKITAYQQEMLKARESGDAEN